MYLTLKILFMRNIDLNFEGYYLLSETSEMPKYRGIYIFYRCVYDPRENNVNLLEILYIGQAKNVNKRINNHNKFPECEEKLRYGETICFSCANVSAIDIDRAENALVYTQKPPLNEDLKDHFHYSDTTLNIEGRADLIRKGSVRADNGSLIIIR